MMFDRLRWFFERKAREREMQQELQAHLEREIEEQIESGLASDAAQSAARKAFGNQTLIEEDLRAFWRLSLLDHLALDVKYAFRQMKGNLGFTLIAVATLALGIGANTAVFSVVNAVLLRPLPYNDSDRIVRIVQERSPQAALMDGLPLRMAAVSTDDLQQWRTETKTLSQMAAYVPTQWTLFEGGESTRVIGAALSPAMFPLLGARPLLGRVFEADEERVRGDAVVVTSYTAWQKYLSGDRNVLNRTLNIEGRGYTVVGVMPPDFEFPNRETEFWIPLVLNPIQRTSALRSIQMVSTIARLAEGVSIESATAEANVVFQALRQEEKRLLAEDPTSLAGALEERALGEGTRIELVSLKDQLVEPVRSALLVLLVAVGFVLLIACANVANLLLARAAGRQREIAIRAALGAGRTRLIRQVLTESITLALIAGVLGTLLAFGGVRVFTTVGSQYIPRIEEIRMDLPVFAFTLAASILTGILFGLAPAWRMRRASPMQTIKEGGSSASGSYLFGRNRTRSVLAVAEIAMAMVLLVGAGLLFNSFLRLANVDRGYDPENLLTFEIRFPRSRYSGPQAQAFTDELLSRLQGLPQIRYASKGNSWPELQGVAFMEGPVQIVGRPEPTGRAEVSRIGVRVIDNSYIGAMGMRVAEGRRFEEGDRAGRPPVVLINRTMARSYFQGQSAVGKTVRIFNFGPPAEIIGIVDDVQYLGLDPEVRPEMYVNFQQADTLLPPIPPAPPLPYVAPADLPVLVPGFGGQVLFGVRTSSNPLGVIATIRDIANQMDSQLIVDDMATMEERLSVYTARPRFYVVLLGIFSTIAVALAAIGIYGLMAYSVSQRTREIGIRIALGGERREVLWLVLRQGLVLAAIGVAAGIVGSLALTRYLQDMLFRLTPTDPITFIIVAGIIAFVAAFASYIPARRATKVDPIVALRYE